MAFKMRTTKPEAGNKYYIRKANGGYSNAIEGNPKDSDCNVLSNCVGYAYGRFNEIGGWGCCKYLAPVNAENFIQYKGSCEVGQTPKLGACMVWQKGATLQSSDGAGHVAIVEKVVSETEVITSESGWGCKPFWNQTRKKGNGNWGSGTGYKFLGFIYNPGVVEEANNVNKEAYTAIEKLATLKVINSPDLWKKNVDSGKVQYLGDLFIKSAAVITKAGTRLASAEDGCAALVKGGVMNTPDYWIKNKNTIQYMGDLLATLGGAVAASKGFTITSTTTATTTTTTSNATTACQKLIATAKAEVGYIEKKSNAQLDDKTANAGSNNWNKYARDLDNLNFYNGKKNGYSWCDVFVDWCFVKTFGETKALQITGQAKGGLGAGCKYSANYYKNMGRFFTTNPQAGDQIFFTDGGTGVAHTGIIEKVDANYIYTIEGNTSSAAGVVANGGCVAQKKYARTYKKLYGFGRPLYEQVA